MTPTVAVRAGDGRDIPSARWISRTFLGWVTGFVLAIGLILAVEGLGLRGVQFPLALGMGLGVGLFQARPLTPWLGRSCPWVVATTLGLTLPFVTADLLQYLGSPLPYSLAGYVALGGLLAGALQWRLLRGLVGRAAWWLAVTPAGWLLAGSTVWINELLLPRTPGLVGALRYVAVVLSGGVVLGAASALAWRLCRNPGAVHSQDGGAAVLDGLQHGRNKP